MQFLTGQLNFDFDPSVQENLPYKLYEYQTPRRLVKMLRLGTPTKESYFAPFTHKATIVPEFKAFIKALKAQNKRHLYINLQNRIPTWTGRNEAPRSRALEDFARKYPDTFLFIGLAKNTPFYYQEGPFSTINEVSHFKELFLEQFFDPLGGFIFINTEEIGSKERLSILFDNVKERFFHDKTTLTKEQRLAFIELLYLEIEKEALHHYDIATMNISCKDGIDRAGAASTLLFIDLFLKGKKSLSPQEILDIEALLLAPALLVKKRAIKKARFLRFLHTLDYLLAGELL